MTDLIDTTVVELNKSIEAALKKYFTQTHTVEFTFDLPDPKHPPQVATISVFLYDVQEDLQLRTGEGRRYDPATGIIAPGLAHVRCCYLLTYWSPVGDAEDAPYEGPDSEAMRAMNRVLNALLHHRTFDNLPGSYTRVIPMQERLNSLGTFWQAMDNKPCLCLSYAVTVPVALRSEESVSSPVNASVVTLDSQVPPR